MDPLRVGIVGTGWMAAAHQRVLEATADAEIVGVCDVDRERAAAFAGEGGASVYSDWRDLLDLEDLGALFVCTPPLVHREPAVTALEQRLPVYLEKPIARSAEDAAVIVAAAEQSGTVCAVGYQWHALDLLGDLRQVLDGQDIGLLVGTSIGPTASRPWFLDRRAGGGNLLERGSHHLDLTRVVAGEVASVQAAAGRVRLARGAEPGGDIDDAVTITLELASGALATIIVAWTRPDQPGTYALDVVASEATLRLDLDPAFTLSGSSRGGMVARRAALPPLERSVRAFLAAVRENRPSAVACTPPDAAATLAVAEAAERALATGVSVEVAQPLSRLCRSSARRAQAPGGGVHVNVKHGPQASPFSSMSRASSRRISPRRAWLPSGSRCRWRRAAGMSMSVTISAGSRNGACSTTCPPGSRIREPPQKRAPASVPTRLQKITQHCCIRATCRSSSSQHSMTSGNPGHTSPTALLAGTSRTSAPSWTASHGSTGCHASLQINVAMRPMRVSKARMNWPGLACLRSSQAR
jgi:myo-inositol 2-dehydrogenase/D-chiro-inositol 1-dehydrogenase